MLLPICLFPVCGQSVVLSYRPVAAEYSKALDRIVMVSGNPNVLHIYNALLRDEVKVDLPQAPLALSVSPDGLRAAVGHESMISYVNLETGAVEKSFPLSVPARSVVLSSLWAYVLPVASGASVSVNLASGAVTPNNMVVHGAGGRLNPAVDAIYGTDGGFPNFLKKYDISTGPITKETRTPYFNEYCTYGPLWFSPDGARIYTGCGTVFRASRDPKTDMSYTSTLPGTQFLGSLDESAALHRIAVLETVPDYDDFGTDDRVVKLFDSTYLVAAGQFALPPFAGGDSTFAAHGRWVFFNAASTMLHVVVQADNESGLRNDFGVYSIELTAPRACGATFAGGSAEAPGLGARATIGITAPANCIYQALSNEAWIQILSGSYGAGDGVLTYRVQPNTSRSVRTGSISLSGSVFVVRQQGAQTGDGFSLLGYPVTDGTYHKGIDRMVLVSTNPDLLHIYAPTTGSEQTVALVRAPLCVSVRRDGAYAAVGHDGWVSYVNLRTRTVERVFPVPTDAHRVVLAANGYIYVFPERDFSDIYSLEVSSGTVTSTYAVSTGRVPRLTADGQYLYVGGEYDSKWDIRRGVAEIVESGGGFRSCGDLWLTEDGRRAITACGKAYVTSEIPAEDGKLNGSLSRVSLVLWADHSPELQRIAVLPQTVSVSYPDESFPDDTGVQIYGDDDLGYQGTVKIPVLRFGSDALSARGRFAFWSNEGSGLYIVTETIPEQGGLSQWAVVKVATSAARRVSIAAVRNGASQTTGRIAPGEIVTITGAGLGLPAGLSFAVDPVTKRVETLLGGTEVYFNGVPGPVLYASSVQVNAIVPYEVSYLGPVAVQVAYQGILSEKIEAGAAQASPGLFTITGSGSGQAVAINQDGTLADESHPALRGSYVTIYFTGGGSTQPRGVTGSVTGGTLQRLELAASAMVGGKAATVSFAGAAPGFVAGVEQLNLRLSEDTPVGPAQPVVLTIGGASSQPTATIAVR